MSLKRPTWSVTFATSEITTGEYNSEISITTTNARGNSSTSTEVLVVDTVAPTADLNTVEGDNVVSASEASDGITLTGTGEAGATIEAEFQGVTQSTTVAGDGTWSLDYTAAQIVAGTYDRTVTITTTDVAGNSSTGTHTVHIDTEQNLTLNAEVGGDYVINAAEAQAGVTFTGTAEPGASVLVTVAGVTQTATVDASGNWSALYAGGALPQGEYDTTVGVTSSDAAGNIASTSSAIRVDTTAGEVALPPLPIEIDDVINAAERADGVVINGTATPGLTVTVSLGGATQQVVADAGGNWSINVPAASIPTGTQSLPISASVSDTAGNSSTATDTVQLDTLVDGFSLNSGAIEGDNVINAAERADGVALTGTVEPGSSVMVQFGTVTQAAAVDASGNWSVNFAAAELPEGTYSASATITATDPAGNSSTLTESFNVDTEIDSPNVDSVTFSGSDVWRIGTQDAEGSYSVNTLDPGGAVGTPGSTISQHPILGTEFTFTSPVSDGTNLVVSRVDSAGNASATLVVLEDGAGAATTVGHAGLGSFDIQALNLDYGENTNLVLSETQIKALSGSSDTLTIHGGTDDTVTIGGAANSGQTQQIDGQSYNVYTLGNDGATVIIEQDINVII